MRALALVLALVASGYQAPRIPTPSMAAGAAASVEEGRSLVVAYGCLGCHAIAGLTGIAFHGPRLDNVGEKLRPEWLRAWLRDPRAVDPAARMGNFHLSAAQIARLEAFLLSLRIEAPLAGDSKWDAADADAGAALFGALECRSCHTPSQTGFSGLAGIGGKVYRDWLFAFLKDPPRLQPGTPMRAYALTDPQVRDLAAFLLDEDHLPVDSRQAAVFQNPGAVMEGRAEFERLSCASCHRVDGVRQPHLVPLTAGHVAQKLISPESFPASAMPAFHLTWKEAASIELAIRNTH
jgi:nitric oxide reductase subunit C